MPRQRIFPALWLFVSLMHLCASAEFASAQTVPSDPRNVDATSFGERITLGPNWLFAPGDNPAWAAPGFDDSGWTTVSVAGELEATRIVQQVIIPEEIPAVPGFMIDSVYKPHGEVGGDFFQIIATKNGGVLVAIGDVSGKGMPAAMTVSLLVGTLRTLAHYTSSPGEILSAMNQRMIGRANGGFTTCLVLRADPGGLLTLANAGHVAPYVNGCELPIGSGLPLGLEEKSTYVESTFQLNPKQQLTLVTDGVVEARNQKGELLGFDRMASLTKQNAAQISDAAKLFGQDDDITVLTLERMVPA